MAGAPEVAPHVITDRALEPIAENVRGGERLSREEGAVLFRTPGLIGLGALADVVNGAKHDS